jgi:hypothetical protein
MSFLEDNISDLTNTEVHRYDGYFILKRSDGIIELRFDEGYTIEIEDAKKIISQIRSISQETKCLLLVVFKDDNSFSAETREYMSSDAVSEIVLANALVTKGLAMEILGQGYIRINQPTRPTRLFKSAAVAIMWLMSFME